jgi:peroxiredoxin
MGEHRTRNATLLLIALIAGRYFWARLESAPVPVESVDRPAPNFSLPEAKGGQVSLDSYRGQPVLLVFWTASSDHCREELPLVSRLAPEFRSKGIAVVTIHVGDPDEAREYLRSNSVAVLSLVDSEGDVGESYDVGQLPKLVLIGTDGKIKRTNEGVAGEKVLREWMDVARPS